MANRVGVNINVNDHSRAGLAQLRANMNRMRQQVRQAGGDIRFNVVIPDAAARRELDRIQRALQGDDVRIRTQLDPPDPPARVLRNRLQRALGPIRVPVRVTTGPVRGPLRALRGMVSGILQDGVGQGIIQGFKAGGPIGAAFLGTLLLGTLSVIGAALSGLLITALGAAFVAVGAVSAFKSKRVTEQWTATLQTIKDEFEGVGEPLVPVLDRALERLQRMARVAGPMLKEALAKTAPATELFINKLMDGFESFGKVAFDPIMDAWNVFAPVFGEQWDEFMRELGQSFADMAKLVKEHPTEIAMALEVVFEALELLVDTVTFFGKAWVFTLNASLEVVGFLGKAVRFLGNTALDVFGIIINGAAGAFGWVPGLGGKLKKAAKDFNEFRDEAKDKLDSIANAADAMRTSLDRANKKRKLEADIRSWKESLREAREKLRKTTSQKARAKLTADISDLRNKIGAARRELNALNGKTAITYIITHSDTYRSVHDIVGKASGGIRGAAGGGARGNMTLVGEQGPELVNLPAGSRVRSNPDTRRLLGSSDRGAGAATVFIDAAEGDVNRMLLRIMRKAVRNEGGDFDRGVGIKR